MKLVIDLGNTSSKLGLFDGKRPEKVEIFPGFDISILSAFIGQKPITSCILSTVVDYDEEIKDFLSKNCEFLELTADTSLPIEVLYRTPDTLGKDRIAAAVGAAYRFPKQNVLVIDAGTCVKFDVISEKGQYLGGAISPGLQMRYNALHTFTSRLPLLNVTDTIPLIGMDTNESISSGVLNGLLAEIDGIIDQYLAAFPDLKIILSGGDMNYFDKRLKNSTFAIPNIVLEGLNEIIDFNIVK